MPNLDPKTPILIADPDLEYAGTLRLDPRARTLPPVIATSAIEAASRLSADGASFSAIFLSPKLSQPLSVPTIRVALKHLPAVPIFFLLDGPDLAVSADDLEALTVRQIIRKPASYSDLLKVTLHHRNTFDVETALRHAAESSDLLDVAAAAPNEEFVPILAKQFISGSASLFDLYVKLGSSRYLKILQAGDCFEEKRVTDYLKRGVHSFYLRRNAQENYLRYCDHLSAMMMRKTAIPAEIKLAAVLNRGEETVSFLRNAGINESSVAYAKQFGERVMELVERLQLERKPALNQLVSSAVGFEHGVGTTLIAALLARGMGFKSEKTAHTIGLAALLHDIGLQGLPPRLQEETESRMSAEELEQFRQHPAIGARILTEMGGIEPAVVQAVFQHHERRDQLGFPGSTGRSGICRVAEIIGLSDRYLHALAASAADPEFDLAREMEITAFPGYSSAVVDVFREVFCKTSAQGGLNR